MKVQFCSDLHLEFSKNREWIKNNPLIVKGDILILAGDIYYLDRDFKELDFIKKVSNEFERVFIMPGNHEYYSGYDISSALKPTNLKILDNVYLLNNYTVNIEGIKFIFSTMWSTISRHTLEVMRGMMDFSQIKFKGQNFTVNNYNEIHQVAIDFLSSEIETEGKKVVITHHLPSFECNAEEFKNSILNEAFCVDKTELILNSDIDYWIYGHSHRNVDDFKIGGTKMITNQFGYVAWKEHISFDYEKHFYIG